MSTEAPDHVILDAVKVRLLSRGYLADVPFVRNHLSLEAYVDALTDRLIVQLESMALGKEASRIDISKKWPADWWQAVRERWLPRWWLKRWPVRYEHLDIHRIIYNVCPHLDITTPSKDRHLRFLMLGPLTWDRACDGVR